MIQCCMSWSVWPVSVTCFPVYTHTCMHAHTHTHIHIHTHTHTHARTHTHTHFILFKNKQKHVQSLWENGSIVWINKDSVVTAWGSIYNIFCVIEQCTGALKKKKYPYKKKAQRSYSCTSNKVTKAYNPLKKNYSLISVQLASFVIFQLLPLSQIVPVGQWVCQ